MSVKDAQQMRHPYDPQLLPERTVVAAKEALAARRENKVTRTGEQYIATCEAGHSVITSDAGEAEAFAQKHRLHKKAVS
jgi:hypothetical protein